MRSAVPDIFSLEYREKLLERMCEMMGYTLPNFISDVIFREKIFGIFFEQNLPNHAETLINEMTVLMEDVLQKLIQSNHNLRVFSKLPGALCDVILPILQKAKARASDIVKAILDVESSQVLTMNPLYMDCIHESRTAIQNKRHEMAVHEQLEKVRSSLNNPDEHVIVKAEGRPLNMANYISDAFITECAEKESKDLLGEAVGDLQISLRVYADILISRLFDVIPLVTRNILVNEIQASLPVSMQKELSDDSLRALFDEEDKVRLERESLKLCLSRMADAEKKLKVFH